MTVEGSLRRLAISMPRISPAKKMALRTSSSTMVAVRPLSSSVRGCVGPEARAGRRGRVDGGTARGARAALGAARARGRRGRGVAALGAAMARRRRRRGGAALGTAKSRDGGGRELLRGHRGRQAAGLVGDDDRGEIHGRHGRVTARRLRGELGARRGHGRRRTPLGVAPARLGGGRGAPLEEGTGPGRAALARRRRRPGGGRGAGHGVLAGVASPRGGNGTTAHRGGALPRSDGPAPVGLEFGGIESGGLGPRPALLGHSRSGLRSRTVAGRNADRPLHAVLACRT